MFNEEIIKSNQNFMIKSNSNQWFFESRRIKNWKYELVWIIFSSYCLIFCQVPLSEWMDLLTQDNEIEEIQEKLGRCNNIYIYIYKWIAPV